MSTNFQNTPGPSVQPMGLGRIIHRTEIWVAPYTKRVFQLRWVQETLDQNGVIVTEEWTEISPETDDGTIPDSVKQLRECPCCYKVVTKTCTCRDCGLEFYTACTKEFEKDDQKKRICKRCYTKIESPILFRIHNNLWGD